MPDRGILLSLQAIRHQLVAMPHDLNPGPLDPSRTAAAFPGEGQ